ncbi:Trk system potassium transporter TrkA [Desulforhopalus singaporensis]|uniref:Trk system potassium uptake protein TrkA n=1 Tax=Desulforhopalus singaporensis TaxID=91360 RepID=A0A1H0L7R6_9BACT|nr:Trk system potassium transporter TrkA [Desulforhopalus singaporensis]SDO63990.1 trk system potassium uptake protein TrkA [Desulforhopalus singaporensis]
MRILLFGATNIGWMIASRMYLGHDVTIIDDQGPLAEKFHSLDISFVSGSGTDIMALQRANAAKADCFIACSVHDEANIVACWTAKKLAEIETVCFVSRVDIFNNFAPSVQNRYHTKYDIDTVIWPEQLLTQDIFRILLVPGAVDVEYFDEGQAKMFEYPIRESSPLCSVPLKDYHFPDDVLMVGIYRDGGLFVPNGSSKVEAGDRAIFMGTGLGLDMLAADIFPKSNNRIKTVAVIGGGNVGFFLAQKMEQADLNVKIIEYDMARCEFLADNLKKSLVLQADGTDIGLLEEESIGKMDAVVCVTNNDEKNLLCSLLVKQLGAQRVVTRVQNVRNAKLFERVGIDVVVSPWESALRELLNHFQTRNVDILAMVERGKGEVVRVTVPADFPDTMVMDLKLPANVIIGMIKRHRGYLIPKGSTVIHANDRLKIFTRTENKEGINAVFTK